MYPQNILFGVDAFIRIVQNISIFLISFSYDVFYCIAAYFPLFLFH